MARVWNTLIFAIATVYFTVDALFSAVTRPITAWRSKRGSGTGSAFGGVVGALSILRPIWPVVILEPAKASAYLLGTGHFLPGAIVFMPRKS
jgi:hypothetical protein